MLFSQFLPGDENEPLSVVENARQLREQVNELFSRKYGNWLLLTPCFSTDVNAINVLPIAVTESSQWMIYVIIKTNNSRLVYECRALISKRIFYKWCRLYRVLNKKSWGWRLLYVLLTPSFLFLSAKTGVRYLFCWQSTILLRDS